MSVNLLVANPDDPVIWRGPVVSGAVSQFWTDVAWGDLDVLFVDMPPGTGDVPLTVFQSLPIDGVVIVTSPQDLVAMIVSKAVKMAKMMDVPALGVVENMSYLVCPDCGKHISMFGESHIDDVAEGFGLDVLARLPIDPAIAQLVDEGQGRGRDRGEHRRRPRGGPRGDGARHERARGRLDRRRRRRGRHEVVATRRRGRGRRRGRLGPCQRDLRGTGGALTSWSWRPPPRSAGPFWPRATAGATSPTPTWRPCTTTTRRSSAPSWATTPLSRVLDFFDGLGLVVVCRRAGAPLPPLARGPPRSWTCCSPRSTRLA